MLADLTLSSAILEARFKVQYVDQLNPYEYLSEEYQDNILNPIIVKFLPYRCTWSIFPVYSGVQVVYLLSLFCKY